MVEERIRLAESLLRRAGVFPDSEGRCLEVGCGSVGWLGQLTAWGVKETNIHGIELDPLRAQQAGASLQKADIRTGDAAQLPWPEKMFNLVIASTVFTSILDQRVRQIVAGEISRVLDIGGALLWYDFRVNNPRNRHVRKVSRDELLSLFPKLSGEIKSLTLAPPLSRFLVPRSPALAILLSSIPALRTHLLAVLVKQE